MRTTAVTCYSIGHDWVWTPIGLWFSGYVCARCGEHGRLEGTSNQ